MDGNSSSFPWGLDGKESACNAGDSDLIPGSGRSPWRRAWQPTPVFLSGEFHGQKSLAGYSPWGHKELDVTERLSLTHSLALVFKTVFNLTHLIQDFTKAAKNSCKVSCPYCCMDKVSCHLL